MRRAANSFADREAAKHGSRKLTFAEAWERGCRLANYLYERGLVRGDRVAVLEDNCLEAVDSFLGIAIAGMVRVPLYARNSAEGHAYMLNNIDCKGIIVSEALANELESVKSRVSSLETILIRDAKYPRVLAEQSALDPMIELNPNDYYIIRHTGGTTGKPKGVAYTHWKWLAAARDWFYPHPPVLPGDSCLHVAPISHASGYWFTPVWLAGGRNVMLEKFDPKTTLDVLESERIAYFLTVPTLMAALVEEPTAKKRDWSALKCLNLGSAPASDTTILRARDTFGDVLVNAYGATECVPLTSMGPEEWFANIEGSNPLRSCGRVHPFARVEIRDENNNPLPVGEVGQIAGRVDGQMTGYWNNPEATAERLIDGWILMGDIGYLDSNGFLYLMDRADDMIVSGGFNIYPLELENVIYSHHSVREVAVFGVPHQKWGEAPMAIVVLRPGCLATEDEIIQLCASKLGSYKKPYKVIFSSDALPKTVAGKLSRKTLREPYWEGKTERIGRA